VWHQRVKLSLGADGSATDALGGAGAVAAGVQRMTLASDDPAVTALQTLDNAISGNEMQVDVVGALPAGTNNIGDVDILSIAAGDNNIGNVDVVTLPELPAGTNNIGDVDVLSVVPGTGATNLGKAEDAAHTTGDVGVMPLSVRSDTAAALGGTDGDYQPLITDANGRLHVIEPSAAGAAASLAVLDDWDESDRAKVNIVAGQAGITAGAGAVGASTPRVTLASDDPAVVALQTLDNAIAGNEMQVDVVASLPAGTNNIGDVDVLTVPADPFGANADAASATGSISAKLRFIAATGIPITGTVTVGSHAVTNAGTFAVQAGQAAHDAAISGNPVRLAGRALTSDYAAVAAGDTADLITTLLGKLVTVPYANPANSWSYASPAAVTDTSDDAAKAAAGAGVRNYITGVQVFNGHDTVGTEVVIKDGSTVLWRGWAEQTGGGCSARFDPPLRGTANTAVNVANITTGSSTYFNLQGFTAAE
jgi:hypothetical protein